MQAIVLDFNGAPGQMWGPYSVPPTPALGGTPAAEQEILQRVREKFIPFNVDVQIADEVGGGDPDAEHVIIGGGGAWYGWAAGVSYVNSSRLPWLPAGAWVFSDNLGNDPKYVAENVCHELGHTFGLLHQSTYASDGAKLLEYSSNNDSPDVQPVMGISYGAERGTWWVGTSYGPFQIQDDVAVLTQTLGLRTDERDNKPIAPTSRITA